MKKIVMMMVMVLMAVGGCGLLPSERIQEMQVIADAIQIESANMSAEIEAMKTAIDEVVDELNRPDLTSELSVELQQTLTEMIEASGPLLARKAEIDAHLANWQSLIDEAVAKGNANAGVEITLYGEAGKEFAGMLPPPWNTVAWAIGSLVVGVGGYITRRQTGEKKAVAKVEGVKESAMDALNNVVAGVSKVITESNHPETVKNILYSEQDKKTVELVKSLPGYIRV